MILRNVGSFYQQKRRSVPEDTAMRTWSHMLLFTDYEQGARFRVGGGGGGGGSDGSDGSDGGSVCCGCENRFY